MTQVTVRQLADSVGTPVERLLTQLNEAGLPHQKADEQINDEDKAQLLAHLRKGRPASVTRSEGKRSLSVTRTEVSELSVPAADKSRRRKVTVAVRKKRTVVARGASEPGGVEATAVAPTPAAPPPAEPPRFVAPPSGPGSEQRMIEAKRELAEQAKRRQQELDDELRSEAAKRELDETRRKAEEPARRKAEAEAKARAKADEEQRLIDEERERQEALAQEAQQVVEDVPDRRRRDEEETQSRAEQEREQREAEEARRIAKLEAEREENFRRKELHVARDKSSRRRTKSTKRGGRAVAQPGGVGRQAFERPTQPIVREVGIPETITVGELAQRMSVKAPAVIKTMMGMGTMVTINQAIDQDTAAIVVEEMGHKPRLINANAVEQEVLGSADTDVREGVNRAPVVTIMGHVDHGKTSLLDYIRRAKVAAGEAGGITQHIGAYNVRLERGSITFLDTPGHAAFTAMRARGAKATDIVVLVVAADDGVMPQTEEAVQHARAAGVPLIVAVNKMDKEQANPDRVKQELSTRDVIPEDWGGDTQFVQVSAMTGAGVDDLLEAILLQSEVLELQAPADGPASGVVIESRLDRGRGPVATILVQSGTLRRGDMLLAGQEAGRVRAMYDENGEEVLAAGPSTPVEVLGLSAPPGAGDEAVVVADDRKAREVAEIRRSRQRERSLTRTTSLENVFGRLKEEEALTLNVVLKADVHGSAEALRQALEQIGAEDARVNVVSAGTGGINESDVNLAIASSAIVIGFNVRADSSARKAVEQAGIDLRYFSVIYDVIDTVKAALEGMMKPEMQEQIIGIAEVREVFRARRFGAIAGCMVTEGTIRRSSPIRVLRDNVVVFTGELESLRRYQEDVQEVRSGTECGIGVRSYDDVKPGDQIEVFERVQVERRL